MKRCLLLGCFCTLFPPRFSHSFEKNFTSLFCLLSLSLILSRLLMMMLMLMIKFKHILPWSTMPLHFNPFGSFVYLLFSNLFKVFKCHSISPLLVHLCIYSFHIYSRSLNAIAFHPLLFAFLLFSHLRLTRWRMAAPSWDSESMLMFKTSRFPRCVLMHFFRLYFLFVKASC